MSQILIQKFLNDLHDLRKVTGKGRETQIREAFKDMLKTARRSSPVFLAQAWEYRLGNRSALEWILDQYHENAPKDPAIREKLSSYRFADHKEKVLDLSQARHARECRNDENCRGDAGRKALAAPH